MKYLYLFIGIFIILVLRFYFWGKGSFYFIDKYQKDVKNRKIKFLAFLAVISIGFTLYLVTDDIYLLGIISAIAFLLYAILFVFHRD